MKLKHAPALAAIVALGLGASGCTHVKNMFHKDSAPAADTSAPASTDGSMAPAPTTPTP